MLARDHGLGRASRSKGKSLDGRVTRRTRCFGSLATDFAPQADVRFGPKADIACLFDHLVGTSQQGRWNVDTERLGRLQIYDELELGR